MPNSEAQAWWADVQHVRETIERRRAGLADSPAPQDAGRETRFSRRAATTVDDLDWTQVSAARAGAYADETGRPLHDGASPRARRPGADGSDHGAARARGDADHLDADGRHAAPRATRRQGARSDAVGRDAGSAAPSSSPPRRRTDDATAAALAPADEWTSAALAPPRRRTVEITGRTVAAPPLPRLVEVERRRPPRRTVERVGPRPDRIALWAVLLGFFLILVAATSSRAATPTVHGHAGATVALHAPAR